MESEPFDERIVVRVPRDLKAQIKKIAEDEETTITGAARELIRDGINSRQKIEEIERQCDQLLEAFISMNRTDKEPQRNRMAEALDDIEKRISALEAKKRAVDE
jgi:TolA-binding protein